MALIKYITGIICMVTLMSLATSCKKKSNAAPAIIDSSGIIPVYINASINGIAWNTDTAICYLINSPNDSTRHNVSFQATHTANGVGTEMDLYIANYTGANDYPVNPPNVTATYYVNAVRHYATAGIISIVSDTGSVMKGTFSFMADSITVANGVINVPY